MNRNAVKKPSYSDAGTNFQLFKNQMNENKMSAFFANVYGKLQ